MRFIEYPKKSERKRNKLDQFIFSSRVRLARNLEGINFPIILGDNEKTDIDRKVGARIRETFPRSVTESIAEAEKSHIMHLLANRIITSEFLKNGKTFVYDENGDWVILLNEDDHVRIFATELGYNVKQIYGRISEVLSRLEDTVDFSFDETYGYLTSSILNVGTGLRISVLTNLYGLVSTKKIENFIDTANKMGYSVVNISEGKDSGLFMIYNIYSLGVSEEDLLAEFESFLLKVHALEMNARKDLFGQQEEVELSFEELFELNIKEKLDWSALLYYVSLIDALAGRHIAIKDINRVRSLVYTASDDYLQYRLNIEKESFDAVRLKLLRNIASHIKYQKVKV